MKKIFSLLKATMTTGMNLFNVKMKGKSGKYLPFVLAFLVMFSLYGNAEMIFEGLVPTGMGFVGISLFVLLVAMLVLLEGIYKSGDLLFNCKDDQLLLSLPIKKSTVLFIRIFKFYVFELLYHFLFFAPAIASYIHWFGFSWSFLCVSIIMLIFLPIIPVVLSCFFGAIIKGIASRFKRKTLLQTIGTIILLAALFALSFGAEAFISKIAENATSINEIITKIYYPAGVYADLIVKFDLLKLIIFILINIAIVVAFIYVLSKVYFNINSKLKGVISTQRTKKKIEDVKIKANSQIGALIKKEFITFFKIPVFLMNAGISSMMYIVISIVALVKYDSLINSLVTGGMNIETVTASIPAYHFLLIVFVALSTTITSSMISLEGKNINIIKSLPVSTDRILRSKIYTSLILSIPALIIGNIILYCKLQYGIIEFLLIMVLSFLLPIFSSLLGLIVNLRFPKLDAENSAQIVKQSASSLVSVMAGMAIIFSTVFIVIELTDKAVAPLWIILGGTIISAILDIILYIVLTTYGVKKFRQLNN